MINVRQAKFKERHIIVDFQMKMAQETEELELDESVLQKGVEAVFEDFNKGIYYVAENESHEIVGCLLTTPEWSEWRNGYVTWIQSVYVNDEYRGKGVFKTMYQHIKELVEKDDEQRGIRLYVEKTNLSAQKVYEAVGMSSDHYEFYEWMKSF